MTPARSLFIATVAVALLLGGRPMAGDAQFPRGLLSAETRAHYCTIETRPMAFGSYDPLDDSPLHAIGQVIYTCGSGNEPGLRSPKNIRIEMARGFSNDYGRRAMAGPDGGNLFYNIYLDATHNTIWGDGSSNTG
ncbi:MAG TPA: spore coat protein U domain-containing protein, partial [Vicinamibacterales bacterium]